jgi:hypothetical protein
MHGHQVDSVHRIDDRIGFITDGEAIQVRGDPADRRVTAVLIRRISARIFFRFSRACGSRGPCISTK